ncbi:MULTISPECIES: LysR family transcriptional regulator [Cobetia]|uniref:LysR family transcriptional regulator n=1 Tax=Cobetia crustatorum TaxID=553385 RepID=A0A558HJJ7_9GAMM|nr:MULTISPECIES: LysR family transcriptional regulator [Cobetia]TVU69287.1 LysR family transcriptional regulator [Cobetia crustatorum]
MKLPFDLRALELFVSVIEHGSFTAAAQSLNLAQSAVSQSIAGLETRLGKPLLVRGSRGLRLTPAGDTLLEHAKPLLEQAQRAALAMAELDGIVKGEVRIGVSSMLGSYYFPPLLMAFKARYPDLKLSVIEGGTLRLRQMIDSGELDLGVVVEEQAGAETTGLVSRHFLREEMVVCLSNDHPLAKRHQISVEEFFAEELVVFKRGYFHRDFVERLASQHGLTASIGFESNLIALNKAIVARGFGITTFLKRVVEDDREANNLTAISFSQPAWLELSLAWRQERGLSRAEQAFVDFVIEHSSDNHQNYRS